MRTRAAAVALLAACSPAGRAAPDEAARSAVADTITQKAALFAQMVNRRDAAAVMTLFADDRDMTYAENGMLYPSRDSLERAITARYGAQRELTFGLDERGVVPLASDAGGGAGAVVPFDQEALLRALQLDLRGLRGRHERRRIGRHEVGLRFARARERRERQQIHARRAQQAEHLRSLSRLVGNHRVVVVGLSDRVGHGSLPLNARHIVHPGRRAAQVRTGRQIGRAHV